MIILMTLIAFTGCRADPPARVSPPPVALAPVKPVATTGPTVLVEAKSPDAFPPPGPVGDVMVKKYPDCRMAVVATKGQDADQMFGSLFNHISTNKIPMTSPVVITWTGDNPPRESAMAFVYSSRAVGTPGRDGAVDVVDAGAMTVVSVGVRGNYDAAHFQTGMKLLQAYLSTHAGQYYIAGPPRYLGYNSPFVPGFARYGEVQIPVELR